MTPLIFYLSSAVSGRHPAQADGLVVCGAHPSRECPWHFHCVILSGLLVLGFTSRSVSMTCRSWTP